MAKNVGNLLLDGFVGKMGGLIYRRRGNKTHVFPAPVLEKGRKSSAAQASKRLKFRDATHYAASVRRNPEMAALYKARLKPHQNIYNRAISDAMRPPVVLEIRVDTYKGYPGDTILISALDDFSIQPILISIYDSLGNLVESGEAVPEETSHWQTYTASVPNEFREGGTISVKVKDLPGNETVAEIIC